MATKQDNNNNRRHLQLVIKSVANAEDRFTIQVVVLLAVRVSQGVELLQQQRVLQNSLDGFDQVRLQSGRVLLSGVPLGQEGLEIGVGFRWKSRNISEETELRLQHTTETALPGFLMSSHQSFTFRQDLRDFGVAGTEGAVDLETIGIIKERASQGEEHFLWEAKIIENHLLFKGIAASNKRICKTAAKGRQSQADTLKCSTLSSLSRSGTSLIPSSSVLRNSTWNSTISSRLPNKISSCDIDAMTSAVIQHSWIKVLKSGPRK